MSSKLLRSILISWDWALALIILILISYQIPEQPTPQFALDLFSTAISVLSIVFSMFLASLAVLITAGDNEFVSFLEEDGSYIKIVSSFKLTLGLLSFSLISFICLHAIFLRQIEIYQPLEVQKWMLVLPGFLGLYSLLATIQSSLEMIKYAELRAKFLSIINKKKY